ncbi:MAG: HlyC/CorC family transporter [Clostridia bacterium]|nr:HlyC/CorC family transporter [Clostridia bacterium]
MLATAAQSADGSGNLIGQIILLFVLILCNAFFAASEIAIITLNDAKLFKMAEDGHKKAKQVLALTSDSSRFLATIQVGVTLAGFLTSATAAQTLSAPLARWFIGLVPAAAAYETLIYGAAVVVVTLLISYFSLVLGELVPKRIAMQKPEPIAFAFIGMLRFVAACTKPFVKFLSLSTNIVVRLCGMDPHADEENVTEEEIRMLVDVGEEKGVIEEVQKDMINNIFEFDDLTAGEVMTPRTDVAAVDIEDSLEEALRIGVDEGYSRLPVYEEDIDHVVGILHIKDLLPYVGRELPKEVTLRNLLRDTYFIPETKHCGDLFSEMTAKHMQMAVVVDEYGGIAGIVTVEDLLESIVGSMQDEFDDEEEEITQLNETSFVVDGSTAMEELADRLDVDLPEGDYETVGGFMLQQLGRIPEADEHPEVQFENVLFTVQAMDDRRVDEVHVELLPITDETEDVEDGKREKAEKDKSAKSEKSKKSS